MKKYLILFLLSCYSFVLNAAEENIKVEETKETIFEAQEKETKENLEKYDEKQRDYSFINNNFYTSIIHY